MIIKSIELHNFRVYKDSNWIDLSIESDRNIVVVSGRNGFGKTTFLMSLVWCLYGKNMGEVDEVYSREIKDQGGYSRYLAGSLNSFAKDQDDFGFSVSVTFAKLNLSFPCEEIVVTRQFNAKTMDTDQVEVLIDGEKNELANDIGADQFIREFIMPIEIAKFFFFDAEKIVSLADSESAEQQRKLSEAYSEVLGIKKYQDLKENLIQARLTLRAESASEADKKRLIDIKAKQELIQVDIDSLLAEDASDQEKINEKRYDLQQIQEKLIRAGNRIGEDELSEIRLAVQESEAEVEALKRKLENQVELIPFAMAGQTMLETLIQIQAEGNQRKRKFAIDNAGKKMNDFLTDLTATPNLPENTVIDYKIRSYYESTVKQLLQKHFFPETESFTEDVETIHEFSDTQEREFYSLVNNLKTSFADELRRIHGDYNRANNELFQLRKRLRDAESQEASDWIKKLRDDRDRMQLEIAELEDQKQKRNFRIGELSNEKGLKTKEVEELSRRLEVASKNKVKDEVYTRQINNLDRFLTEFKIRKKESLQRQIKNGLSRLMHKNDFIKHVQVEIITDSIDIVLLDNRGQEVNKASMSKGEQQMFATALLWALVEESDIEFPVFIDSPMQKFDDGHAERIVTEFYPNISEQVVLFPLIIKELNEDEFRLILDRVSRAYLIDNVKPQESHFMEVTPSELFATYRKRYGNAV